MKIRDSLRIICEASGDKAIPESALDEEGEIDESDVRDILYLMTRHAILSNPSVVIDGWETSVEPGRVTTAKAQRALEGNQTRRKSCL